MKNKIIPGILAASLTACAPSASELSPQPETIVTVRSQLSFSETDQKLKSAIESRGLKVFTIIDHGNGAKSVNQDIGQSKLYIFGNPKAGTPLMIANPEMGLELPLKMLINETASGDVQLNYKDLSVVARNYNIAGKDELLMKISNNLAAIAQESTRE